MTEIILVLLTFTQIPVLFIFGSRVIGGQIAATSFRKNPDWLLANSGADRHRMYTRLWYGFCYLLAASTLFAAVNFTLISPVTDPGFIVEYLLALPMMVWWFGFMAYWGFLYFGIARKIPAPAKRAASLENRQLSTFVPLWIVYLGYALVTLAIVIYGWAWISDAVESGKAMRVVLSFSFTLLVITFSLLITVRRKHTEVELLEGNVGRGAEVMVAVGALYFCSFAGVYRILADFFDITLVSSTGLSMTVFAVVQLACLATLLHPKVRSLHREYRETYLLTR